MRLLWQYVRQYKRILFVALAFATVNQVFSLLDPQIFRLLVDRYASRAAELPRAEFIGGVVVLILASVGVAFVSRVAKNFQDYYVNVVTQRVGAALYGASVAHSFSLPYSVFEDQRSGELLQNLERAKDDSHRFIQSFVSVIFLSTVGITFVLAYAFTVHWTVGAAYLLVIPTLGGSIFFLSRRIRKIQERIIKEKAELAGSTTETIRNVELVKSLGLEAQETKRLNDVNDKILALELNKVRLTRTLSFFQGTLINLMRSLLMLLMLWLIVDKAMTLGEFFSLLFYSFFVFAPLSELGDFSSRYQETRASMARLEEILRIPPQRKPVAPATVAKLETIAFKKVSFAYARGAEAVRDIALSFRSGETVAFVGPSGSGKTTIVKLLVGLYEPTKGVCEINGLDSRTVDFDALRRRIGYVSQETQLFAGTIRENLLFVRPEATDEECLAALRAAQAMPILERTGSTSSRQGGKGLDTKIGEGGIKVSGGERQRLAIARALLRNPDLIIFDEATSSLDSITERAVAETIRKVGTIRPDLITVLIAHRLSTVAHAKRIYVLERGMVKEEGTHAALLRRRGLYAALWREQSGEGSRPKRSNIIKSNR